MKKPELLHPPPSQSTSKKVSILPEARLLMVIQTSAMTEMISVKMSGRILRKPLKMVSQILNA